MRRILLGSAVAAATFTAGSACALGALEVQVLDGAGGRPVAGVVVHLANPATGFAADRATDADGRVLFPALATTGTYVASSGEASSAPVELRTNFRSAVTLLAGRRLDEVVVEGARSVSGLNLSNAEISASLSARELAELPVEGRDLATVLFRLPNVTQATGFFPEAPAVAINGANALFAQYLIDGLDNNENFLGGQKFPTPIGMVGQVTVLANSYSTEFGRTANGVINITSKGGTNDVQAEAFLLWRPGASIDSATRFPRRDLSGNAVQDGFRRYQGGASVSGPIVRDRTFFFVNAEVTRDTKDNRLTVPALGVDSRIRGHNSFDYYTLRLDQVFSDAWSGTLRLHRGDVQIERQGGGLDGGFTFPSAGDTQLRQSHVAALEVRRQDAGLTYVGNLQFSAFDWNYGQPNQVGPQVVILNALDQTIGVIGNDGFVFDNNERTWQTKHKVTFDWGRAHIHAGVDLLRADFALKGGGNANGNYTVRLTDAQLATVRQANRGSALSLSDIPASAQVLDYTVELRPARFGRPQTLYGTWLESEFTLTPDLTARLGVRYDYDSLTQYGTGTGDRNNIAPRGSFNFRVDDRSVIRGGGGLYYEKLPYAVISDALQRNSDTPGFRAQLQSLIARGILPADTDLNRILHNGNATVTVPGVAFLQGPSGASLQANRALLSAGERQILNPFGYANPSSIQASLGYQRKLAPQWIAEADLLFSRGRNLVRLIDLNGPSPYQIDPAGLAGLTPAQKAALVRSPAAADATRPTGVAGLPGGANSILISDTGGKSQYKAINLSLEKLPGEDPYGVRVSYTLSRLKNDTDDINFRAQDANNFSAEWAPSLNDRTHTLSAILYLEPLDGLTVSLAGLFQSGQPINYGPDAGQFGTTDLNGDGRSFTNQYTGNPDRAPGRGRNSGRLPWSKVVDVGVRYALALGGGTLEVSADIFNLFNTTNLGGYVVNATASNQFQIAGQGFIQRSAGPPRTFQFGLRWLY